MTDIRAARASDLDEVVALEAGIFGDEAWSPRSLEDEFGQLGTSRVILVCVDRGRIVAYADAMVAGDSSDLHRIAVAPTHRRLGLAGRLVAAVVAQARQRGAGQLLIEVAAGNEAALALYARTGFAEIDRRPRYYADGQDAVVMRRALDG